MAFHDAECKHKEDLERQATGHRNYIYVIYCNETTKTRLNISWRCSKLSCRLRHMKITKWCAFIANLVLKQSRSATYVSYDVILLTVLPFYLLVMTQS